jgi:putative endonuclease
VAFWTYMLECADGRFYIGHTDALEQRVAQHRSGKGCDFTARRQPVLLVWSESFGTRLEALTAERQIKGWSRAKKAALVARDWKRISELAVSREARPSTGSGRTDKSELLTRDPFVLSEVEGRAPSNTLAQPTRSPNRTSGGSS